MTRKTDEIGSRSQSLSRFIEKLPINACVTSRISHIRWAQTQISIKSKTWPAMTRAVPCRDVQPNTVQPRTAVSDPSDPSVSFSVRDLYPEHSVSSISPNTSPNPCTPRYSPCTRKRRNRNRSRLIRRTVAQNSACART